MGIKIYKGSEGQVRLTYFEKMGHPVPVPLTPVSPNSSLNAPSLLHQ